MSRPIRHSEGATVAKMRAAQAMPERSPTDRLAQQMLEKFGEKVRAASPSLPPSLTPLRESLLSPTDEEIIRISGRLLGPPSLAKGEPSSRHAVDDATRTRALQLQTLRTIAAGIAKAETPGAGFQFLRALLMVLTLGLFRLQQKRPFTQWVQSALENGMRVPTPLTPSFCAEVISLKQLHRGLLEQAAGSPAAASAASQLGSLLNQIKPSLESKKSVDPSASEQALATALLDDLNNTESQDLEDLLQAIVQSQLANWSSELPDRIAGALKAAADLSQGPSEARLLAEDLEMLHQLQSSPNGQQLQKTLATAAPLGLGGGIRTSLQAAWNLPASQLLSRMTALAGLLKAYDPFFQPAQASPRGGTPEPRPSDWLKEARPSQPESYERLDEALKAEADSIAALATALDGQLPTQPEQSALIRSRLEQLATLSEAVPTVGERFGQQFRTKIAQGMESQTTPDRLLSLIQTLKTLLGDLPPERLNSLQLKHLVQEAWSAADLKTTLVDGMSSSLRSAREEDLAPLLQRFDQSLAGLGALVGQRTLRRWVTQALASAALARPELRARAARQLMDGAVEQLDLAMQLASSDVEWLPVLKEQLGALHAVGGDNQRLAQELLTSATEVVSQRLLTAPSAEDVLQRAAQAATWGQTVATTLPTFDPIELLTAATVSQPMQPGIQLALERAIVDATHSLLRDPSLVLQPRELAILGLLRTGGVSPGTEAERALRGSAPGEIAQSLLACPIDELEKRWKTLSQIGRGLNSALGSAEATRWLEQGLEIALELQLESVIGALSGPGRGKSLSQESSRAGGLWRLASKELSQESAERLSRRLSEIARTWAQDLDPPESLTEGMLRTTVPWNARLSWSELVREGGKSQLENLLQTSDQTPEQDGARILLQAARKMGKSFEVPPPPTPSALQGLLALERALRDPTVRVSNAALVSAGGLEWTQMMQKLQSAIQSACTPESTVLWEAGLPTGIDILQDALDARLVEPSSVPATLNSYLKAHQAEALFDALQGASGPVADLMRVMASQLVLAQTSPAGIEQASLPLGAEEFERITQQTKWVELAKTFPRQFQSFCHQLLERVKAPSELAEVLGALGLSYGPTLPEPLPAMVGRALARALEESRTEPDRARLKECRMEYAALLRSLPDAPASVTAYLAPKEALSAALGGPIPPDQLDPILNALNLRIAEDRPEDDTAWLGAQQYNLFKDPSTHVRPSRDLLFPGGLLTPLGLSILDHAKEASSSLALFVPPLFRGRGLNASETSAVADYVVAAQGKALEQLATPELPEQKIKQSLALVSPEFLLQWLKEHPDLRFPARVGQVMGQLLVDNEEAQLIASAPSQPTPFRSKRTGRKESTARMILERAQAEALSRIGPREATRLASDRASLETLLEQGAWQKNLLSQLAKWTKASRALRNKKNPEISDLQPLLKIGHELEGMLRPFFDTGVQPSSEQTLIRKLLKQQPALNESTNLLLGKLIPLPDSPEKEALLHLAPQIRAYFSALLPSETP